ncbi:TetR/AcrR family transcriptional regulator [Actinomadura parmotrematis]|uniref:TetR/AcrR family transcriptional regulator n=1 Tax=Actinomadura parmotrematis TaxID=2864039 RepID=A0ABS7FRW4_9ACTN|nr:TetR/AcrR family transcriptional regulator [Actinomadura parmotrematis]MBW8483137.1 TetR/AcrR family transcriptional regulator [Actinomadura parmotrematis]
MEGEEQIISVAARLFAELGYDSTELALIADAAGTDTATVRELTGGKADLYRRVMLRAYRAEQGMLESALAGFAPTPQGARVLADAYLDFYAANPQIVALWMQRWMGDASDVGELEAEYADPQAASAAAAVAAAVPADVDVSFLLRTAVWCVFGFLTGGLPGHPDRAGRERTEDELAEFRAYFHTLLERMLAPCP